THCLYCLCFYLRLFFFFQAEDGIRDWSVTGVQTCALPISDNFAWLNRGQTESAAAAPETPIADQPKPEAPVAAQPKAVPSALARSEERRVGKEGRWRWARDQ